MSDSTLSYDLSTMDSLVTSTLDLSKSGHYTPGINGGESVISFTLGVLGVLGNGLVLLVLLSHKASRRRISNILVMNQSLEDFLASCSVIFTYVSKSMGKSYDGRGIWYCVLVDSDVGIWIFLYVSTSSLMIITMERYLMVVHPIFYRNNVTRKRIFATIAIASWAISALILGGFSYPTTGIVNGQCAIQSVWPNSELITFCVVISVTVFFLCPVALFIICYGHMLCVLKSRRKVHMAMAEAGTDHNSSKLSKTEINLTKVMVIVSICFIVCWGPIFIHYALYGLAVVPGLSLSSPLYSYLTRLCCFNSCINPLVYAFKYDDFKRNLKRMICRGNSEQLSSTS